LRSNDDESDIFGSPDSTVEELSWFRSQSQDLISKKAEPWKWLYIQMEYCSGETLKDWIEDGEHSEERKYLIVWQIIDGLEYLHSL